MIKQTSRFLPIVSACLVSGSLFFMSACGNDGDSIRPKVEFPTKYSDFTPEENKEKIQDNGIALVGDLDDLQESPGITTGASLVNILNGAPLNDGGRQVTNNRVFTMIQLLAKFGAGEASGNDVLNGFRQKDHNEPETLVEAFETHAGTYTYSRANNAWTYAAGSGSVNFEFPSTEAGTANNAKLSIYNFTTKEVSPDNPTGDTELPTSLSADLSVNGQNQIEYRFSASYKSNGDPTAVNTSLTLGDFKFSFAAKNTTSEVSSDYALTRAGSNLIAFGAGASGNFNTDSEPEAPSEIVSSASAYFQLKNIKLAGSVNVKKLENLMAEGDGSMQDQADALTEATDIIVYYADTKEKIADTEFYVSVKTDEWSGMEYEEIDIRLVFEDDSAVDLATYAEEGFEELEQSIENLITKIEGDFGG